MLTIAPWHDDLDDLDPLQIALDVLVLQRRCPDRLLNTPAETVTRPRTLPFTCTGISIVS